MNNNNHSFPEPKYLPAIFPYQTCVSIIKTLQGASVYTSERCLELDILSSKVPYIARELFGIIIQIEHGRLHIRVDSGANATFNAVMLTGANHDAAKKMLGQVYTAVHRDAHFVQEFDERGEVLTSYITLVMKCDAKDNSRLRIEGSASAMDWIVSQLWQAGSTTGSWDSLSVQRRQTRHREN